MARRIAAKVEEYEKDGQTKGKYVDIGVIMENDNGEYVLLDPSVNLAGVLIKQRLLNPQKAGKSIMCAVFDDSNRQQQSPAQQQHQDQKANGYQPEDIPF